MRPTALLLLGLAALVTSACGGPDPEPPQRRATAAPVFFDMDPHSWTGRTPWHYPVHGIDVSRWQGEIDWPRVASAGARFAFIKATEGGDVADPMFARNWAAAGAAGVPRGAYHFYYFCRTAREQAAWFIRHVPRERGALPPVLDMEWNHQSRTCPVKPEPATVRAEMTVWLDMVGRHYGQRPVIYVTPDFYADNALWLLEGRSFWLRSVAGHPSEVYPGQPWAFWQYTGTGVMPGVEGRVDINAFAGNEGEWRRWLAQATL